jgi:hypothetical protein
MVWPVWERIAHRLWPTSNLPTTEFGVLEFRLVSYNGRPLQLPGHGLITSGALVGELHCNNQNLLKALTVTGASPVGIGRSELRCLARWATDADPDGKVVAFYGTTYMTLMRLGFTRYDHPAGARAWMDQLFMIGLLALYSPEGVKRLRRGRIGLSSSPPQMWISRRELLRLYGPDKQVINRCSPVAETSLGLP